MKVGNLKVYWNYPGEGVTLCYVEDLDGNKVAEGRAATHYSDKWNKWRGRKVAFTRAMTNIPTKVVRKTLWNALRKESPKTFKFGNEVK